MRSKRGTSSIVVFDWNGTLAINDVLVPGARSLLEEIEEEGHRICVVSRFQGPPEKREMAIRSLVPEAWEIFVTSGEKLLPIRKATGGDRAFVIGDRIRKEITDGNKIGCITIWISEGRYRDELPRSHDEIPTISVKKISDLLSGPLMLTEMMRRMEEIVEFEEDQKDLDELYEMQANPPGEY